MTKIFKIISKSNFAKYFVNWSWDDISCFSNFNKSINGSINIFCGMSCRELYTNSSFPFRYNRVPKSYDENTTFWKIKNFIFKVTVKNLRGYIQNYALHAIGWKYPYSAYLPNISSAISEANWASPSMTGQIGWSSPAIERRNISLSYA